MPSSHLILCRPLLLLPPIPPSIRVFSNESTLRMRWPKYWSFCFSFQLKPGCTHFSQIDRPSIARAANRQPPIPPSFLWLILTQCFNTGFGHNLLQEGKISQPWGHRKRFVRGSCHSLGLGTSSPPHDECVCVSPDHQNLSSPGQKPSLNNLCNCQNSVQSLVH